MTIVRVVTVALLAGLFAAPVYAQGPYVGASIGADIARFSSSDGFDNPATGEALSWALRLGGPIGSRFGVELEFARPEEIESEDNPVRILADLVPGVGTLTVIGGGQTSSVTTVFPVPFNIRTSRRNTTLTASAWARQEVSRRFSMVYLGGIGFNRIEQVYEYNFGGGGRANPLIPTILPRSTRTTEYSVGPMVGVEARVGMSEHLRLVPGIRLHGLDNGWLVRPAVGLAWEF